MRLSKILAIGLILFLAAGCTGSTGLEKEKNGVINQEAQQIFPYPYQDTSLHQLYLKHIDSVRQIRIPDLPQPDGYIGKGEIWQTPYYVREGKTEGPTVLILGGTHGHEMAGWIAAQRLLEYRIDVGKVYLIPRINYRAVTERHRFIPGEKDLNRCYPGDPTGETTDRLAFDVFEFVKNKKIQILLDLHESFRFHLEGGLGQTLIIYPNDETAWIAMAISESINEGISEPLEKIVILQGPKQGSTAWASGKFLGIQGYTVETAIPLPLEKRIEYQILMVRSILIENGIQLDHDSS
ncbi:succinylglutamate desuccinylase/aspartoacylase family protein [bacterium]|nr:succinylglutamate desuccinylase/aspartoacylase family protein [bacterium]